MADALACASAATAAATRMWVDVTAPGGAEAVWVVLAPESVPWLPMAPVVV